MLDELVNRNATHTGEAVRKESSWRLGPVSDVIVVYSVADDEEDNAKVDDCENHVDSGRYLDIS